MLLISPLAAILVVGGAYWFWRMQVVVARYAVRRYLDEHPPLPELGPEDDR